MMLPFRLSLKQVDKLLENRFFQFLLWTVAVGIVTLIGAGLLQGTVHRVELVLQDWKMLVRTSYAATPATTPSKDIVILGIDGNTDKYIRMNPESGLNIVIQRDKLAKIVDYLTDQGAKAVIFDLEFKDSKPG